MKQATLSFLILTALGASAFAADTPVFNLTIKDHKFLPDTAGQKVKLVVKNEGPGAEEFESHDLNREKVIPQGKSVDFFVWRESLEAVLIIGILYSFLSRRPESDGGTSVFSSRPLNFMWAGVLGGILLSVLLGLATMKVQDGLSGLWMKRAAQRATA